MGLQRSEMFSSWLVVVLLFIFYHHPELCYGLNEEARTLMKIKEMVEADPFSSLVGWTEEDDDPCSWSGIGCQDGRVVSLNLRDFCLKGQLSSKIGSLFQLKYLDLHNNSFYGEIPREIGELQKLEYLNLGFNNFVADEYTPRFLQQSEPNGASPPPAAAPVSLWSPSPSPNAPEPQASSQKMTKKPIFYLLISICTVVIVGVCIVVFKHLRNDATVTPFGSGSSYQRHKAFVGVPVFQRSELQEACEDFSNVIGSSPEFVLYKGTLSSGVEVAVSSYVAKSAKKWSRRSESQFRDKIATLSKLNHKNLVNLVGYCNEDRTPFTRMMVFEYAPNGSLHDHLIHGMQQHLSWGDRKRIAMGIAYCLDYIHNLDPPVVVKNLELDSILLTDDYAAKISSIDNIRTVKTSGDPGNNVYQYGILLLQMISGRLEGSELLITWVSDFFNGVKPAMKDLIDPMVINTLREEEEQLVSEILGVAKDCVNPDPKKRPASVRDVVERMREITQIKPDSATPKLSPLWWAELEIISTEEN